MQPQVQEVGGQVLTVRPRAGGVGDNQRDAMRAQQPDERLALEARVADLDRMPQPAIAVAREADAPPHPGVAAPGERERCRGVARQRREERRHARLVEPELRRKLPKERPELLVEREHAGGEEVGERPLEVAEAQEVGDVAAPLDAEHEPRRGVAIPAQIARRGCSE